jgi:hypothetical protein
MRVSASSHQEGKSSLAKGGKEQPKEGKSSLAKESKACLAKGVEGGYVFKAGQESKMKMACRFVVTTRGV